MVLEHASEEIKKTWEEFLRGSKDLEFGEENTDYYTEKVEGREFKEWHHITVDDPMSDDEFDYDWYQGDVVDGKPDGKGIFLKLMCPELSISYFKNGARHGPYTMIRYDG